MLSLQPHLPFHQHLRERLLVTDVRRRPGEPAVVWRMGQHKNINAMAHIYSKYMSVTTVRVDSTTKQELDRLQGWFQAETGERISHSDLLRRLLGVARRHEAELFAPSPTWRPPSLDAYRRLRGRIQDWGVETDARRVDEVLYGEGPEQ